MAEQIEIILVDGNQQAGSPQPPTPPGAPSTGPASPGKPAPPTPPGTNTPGPGAPSPTTGPSSLETGIKKIESALLKMIGFMPHQMSNRVQRAKYWVKHGSQTAQRAAKWAQGPVAIAQKAMQAIRNGFSKVMGSITGEVAPGFLGRIVGGAGSVRRSIADRFGKSILARDLKYLGGTIARKTGVSRAVRGARNAVTGLAKRTSDKARQTRDTFRRGRSILGRDLKYLQGTVAKTRVGRAIGSVAKSAKGMTTRATGRASRLAQTAWYGKHGLKAREAAKRFAGMSGGMGGAAKKTASGARGGISGALGGAARMVGTGAKAAGGAVAAGGAAATGAALTALTVTIGVVTASFMALFAATGIITRIFKRQADELEQYSGAIAGARARMRGEDMAMRVDRAQRIGGAVAQMELARHRLSEATYGLWTEILSVMMEFKPQLEFIVDAATLMVSTTAQGIAAAELSRAYIAATLKQMQGDASGWMAVAEAGMKAKAISDKVDKAFDEMWKDGSDKATGQVDLILNHNPFGAGGIAPNMNPANRGRI